MPKVRATRVQCPVWMDEASDLVANAAQLLPDKEAPIICFCAVGGRAGVAKSALEAAGYSSVINAGGLQDIQALASSLTAEGRLAGLGIELPELVPLGRYVPYVSLSAGVPPAALARLAPQMQRRIVAVCAVAFAQYEGASSAISEASPF